MLIGMVVPLTSETSRVTVSQVWAPRLVKLVLLVRFRLERKS